MKHTSTLILKVVIFLIAIVVLTAMIWFPQIEGRAVDLDLVSIYMDPFIIYSYIASIPFFVGLYQVFKLLNDIEQNNVFSQKSVTALKNIKNCAIALIVFILVAGMYIVFGLQEEDKAGGIAMVIITTIASLTIASAARIFEKLVQNVVDKKSENDLTV